MKQNGSLFQDCRSHLVQSALNRGAVGASTAWSEKHSCHRLLHSGICGREAFGFGRVAATSAEQGQNTKVRPTATLTATVTHHQRDRWSFHCFNTLPPMWSCTISTGCADGDIVREREDRIGTEFADFSRPYTHRCTCGWREEGGEVAPATSECVSFVEHG